MPKNFTRSRFSLRNRSPTTTSNSVETSTSTTDDIVSVSTVSTDATPVADQFLDTDSVESADSQSTIDCGVRTGDNHPWIAVLEHTDPTGRSGKKTLSKGVLIDERHVLTTVSSVHNSHAFWTV